MELVKMIHMYSERFIPVFVRVAVLISLLPYIGSKMIPMVVRVGFAIGLTLLIIPVTSVSFSDPVLAIFESLFIGAAIGLLVRIIMGAVEVAAQWMSLEMGLSVAAVFNPQFNEVLSPLSLLYSLSAMGLFFVLNLHYFFIEGISKSFTISTVNYGGVFDGILKVNKILFPLALKIAAPVFLVQIIVNLGMGFISKVMPQANVFFVGFPLLLFVGFVFMALSFPYVGDVVSGAFVNMKDFLALIVR